MGQVPTVAGTKGQKSTRLTRCAILEHQQDCGSLLALANQSYKQTNKTDSLAEKEEEAVSPESTVMANLGCQFDHLYKQGHPKLLGTPVRDVLDHTI